MKQAIRINPTDNVAVAIKALKAGDIIDIEGSPLKLVTDVVPGHKIALNDIKTGEMIVKYGFPIGHAIHDIAKGALLDDHDIKTNLSGELNYDNIHIQPQKKTTPHPDATFQGYRRSNGLVGVRNELWVIPTVGCVNGIAQNIVEEVKAQTNNGEGVDAIVAFPHNYGCSQLGEDNENTRHILRDLVLHPNAGGVLIVGLGCENNQPHEFMKLLGDYDHDRIKLLVCQEVEGNEVEAGTEMLMDLYDKARHDQRTAIPASELRIGLKCGGSDGFSGITANPLVGAFSDWLCNEQGGTTVLTEVPEMFGAETLLMQSTTSSATVNPWARIPRRVTKPVASLHWKIKRWDARRSRGHLPFTVSSAMVSDCKVTAFICSLLRATTLWLRQPWLLPDATSCCSQRVVVRPSLPLCRP